MADSRLRLIVAIGLVMGALFGVAGTFAPTAHLRALAWGVDGTALIVAGALLTIHHTRRGNELAAGGFLVFVVGEALILAGAGMDLVASAPTFAAGVSLWAASLVLVSVARVMPLVVRALGFIAALLFAIVAVSIFQGEPLTPLSGPLPFFAYPFLAATLCGWAWTHYRGPEPS